MPANKKQHFVPQFYLKNFADDFNRKSIGLFHLDSKQVYKSVSIRSQCQEDYFYSKNLECEKKITLVENNAVPVIAQIILENKLPSFEQWCGDLLLFIVLQYGRTRSQKNVTDSCLSHFAKSSLIKNWDSLKLPPHPDSGKYSFSDFEKDFDLSVNEPAVISNYMTMLQAPLLLDLEMAILNNSSEALFVTSDNPVVLYNKLYEDLREYSTIGLASTGLQVFFPLSPRTILMLYDPNVYKLKVKNGFLEIKDLHSVQELNKLQWLSADENIYFNPSEQSSLQAKRDFNKFIRLRKFKSNVNFTDIDPYLRVSKLSLNCKLNLPFVRLKQSIKQSALSPKPSLRNPVFCDLHQKFIALVKKGSKTFDDFDDFFNSYSFDFETLYTSRVCRPLTQI
jgi:hypothetical protein